MRLPRSALAAVLLGLLAGCKLGETAGPTVIVSDGRIAARPLAAPTHAFAATPGVRPLGLANGRDGLLYIPSGYDPAVKAPLVVLLHGAGRDASEMVEAMKEAADSEGVILVAPDSRAGTWDLIAFGQLGADVFYTNLALTWAFQRLAVDPARVGLAGFSDGASYAITLGSANGDLFSRVAVFSPGFLLNTQRNGKPEFFITHGASDNVLPAGQTRLFIVPGLRDQGYTVTYTEFAGGHGVTKALVGQAFAWLAGPRPATASPTASSASP